VAAEFVATAKKLLRWIAYWLCVVWTSPPSRGWNRGRDTAYRRPQSTRQTVNSCIGGFAVERQTVSAQTGGPCMNGKGLVIWFTMLAGFCQSLYAQKSFGESPVAYLGQMPPASRAASSSMWGDLQAGSYNVGFRTIFRYDSSRPWTITRHYRQPFSPDFDGRPIQINIWYPAPRVLLGKKMEYKDYAEQSAPPAFVKFMHAMAASNHEGAIGSVPESETRQLLATQMNAVLNAKPAPGHFPAVLYFGGYLNDNVVLGEYLASRGYVFAAISLIGPTEEQILPSLTSDEVGVAVQDMDFAWSILQGEPNVDKGRLAVMGQSFGGSEAISFAMHNTNVSAVIGLDGAYGFRGNATALTNSHGYDPATIRAALLDLRRAQGAQGNAVLDTSVVESFRYSERISITMERMHHSDFTSFAIIGSQFHAPLPGSAVNGWNREIGRTGYERVCRIVLSMLDAQLKSDPSGLAAINREVIQATGLVMRQMEAAVPPPSPADAVALTNEKGFDIAKNEFVSTCGPSALATCVDFNRFNTAAYDLLDQQRARDALVLFQLNAWAHPKSADALDSLADGYIAVKSMGNARQALENAIALAQSDPSLDAGARASFVAGETAKLLRLK
jgi:dienelactone hydrolase